MYSHTHICTHLHVRTQVRSKTPRVETSVVIANQHPQLPKKLNFVFAVVARMPPPRTPSNKVGFIRFVFLLVRLCESTLHWKGRGEEGGEVKFLGEWITFLVRAEAGGCSPEVIGSIHVAIYSQACRSFFWFGSRCRSRPLLVFLPLPGAG